MAIAFRSVGARLKADVAVSTAAQQVPLPPGHTTGDFLLMVINTDDSSTPSVPSGWVYLGRADSGPTVSTAYRVHTRVYYRQDTGSLGSSVTVTFNTSPWPAGNPYVLAFIAAYTGVDTAGPFEAWSAQGTLNMAPTQAHPQLSTAVNGDWLLTLRTGSAWQARTVTASGGTNTERVDDNDGFGELYAALYDSGAGLTPGTQTQRSTTAAGGDELSQSGSTMWSLALKPVTPASSTYASPGTASVSATAYDATVQTVAGGWDLCGEQGLPAYRFVIDWDGLADSNPVTGVGEDVTGDIISDISVTYGRDQERQLSPAAVGSAAFTLNNSTRRYSPENVASPLHGDLDPAREMRATVDFNGQTYALFNGRIDDYNVHADYGDRTAEFTFLDALNGLSGIKLSTGVYGSMRTGDLINTVLDLVGWTAGRDIDDGATVVRYWWAEGTDALSAINDLVKSEGPPAVAYVAPDGTFTFRDRHHRLLRTQSREVRATFTGGRLGDCAYPPGRDFYTGATATADGVALTPGYLVADNADASDVAVGDTFKLYTGDGSLKEDTVFTVASTVSAFGFTNIYFSPDAASGTSTGDQLRVGNFPASGLDFTKPFTYSHGWRDVVNSVTFDVEERAPSAVLEAVWTDESTYVLAAGQSVDIEISGSDPFVDAVTPVAGTDVTYATSGAGTLDLLLSRTSGASTRLTLRAVGGPVTVTWVQLRARPLTVQRAVKVSLTDPGSITRHGERAYPDSAPWASPADAEAIANMVLLHYARRRPTVQLRIVSQDPTHFVQVLQRTVSDRVHIINEEVGLDHDFFVERVTHSVQRLGREGRAPVHSVVLGCERDLEAPANVFTFDQRGSGFDQGAFDLAPADNPATVFIFDDPAQGRFDTGIFGT